MWQKGKADLSIMVGSFLLLMSPWVCVDSLKRSQTQMPIQQKQAVENHAYEEYHEEYAEDTLEDVWELDSKFAGMNAAPDLAARSLYSGSGNRLANSSQWQCNRSHYIQPSPEDVHMGQKQCPAEHVLGTIEYNFGNRMEQTICQAANNDFGSFMEIHGKRFYWVECLKCASRSVHELLRPYVKARPSDFSSDKDAEGVEAFAMVRHPVARFISAYGTIMQRLSISSASLSDKRARSHRVQHMKCMENELKEACLLQEPARFSAFVDLYVKHGTGLVNLSRCPNDACLLNHAFSISWFMSLWPGPINFLHVESFADDVAALSKSMGVELNHDVHKNIHEGITDGEIFELLNETKAVQKLHDYLRADITRFGYQPLHGFV